jgi:hypothetical protein
VSYNSVSQYIVRLYNYLKPKVVAELSELISKIYISFNRWTTKGSKRRYLGIVAYYVSSKGTLKDLPIALLQLIGAYSSKAIAKVILVIFKEFKITVGKLSYFVLNNAYNNNTIINTLASKIGFSAVKYCLAYSPYIFNLIS